jgi:hypothetical protein
MVSRATSPVRRAFVNEPLEERARLVGALDAREDAGQVAHRLNTRRVVERLGFLGSLSAEPNRLRGVAPMNRIERQLRES